MLTEHAYMRAEFDWLAVDQDDLVGFFSSSGYGPVPEASVEDGESLEDILDRIRELPRIGPPIPIIERFNPPDWMDAAERGFFSYLWSHTEHQYELVARPSQPLRSRDIIDPRVRELAERVRLPIRLSQLKNIAPGLLSDDLP